MVAFQLDAGVGIPVLAAESLTLYRGRRRVYEDLTLSLEVGVTALLGPNGAGKTTLIEGLLSPDRVKSGRVLLDGAVVPADLALRAYWARVGHMPQSWRFYPGFTARESVTYAAWLKNMPSSATQRAADAALQWVDLTAQRNVKVRRLSGGMRQRVGLAEAFVNDPRLVLLDEPTVGLDPAQRASFRDFVRAKSTDRAVVISTHLIDDVSVLADRVVVIDAGRIVFNGSVGELEARGQSGPRAASLLESGYLAVVGAMTGAVAS